MKMYLERKHHMYLLDLDRTQYEVLGNELSSPEENQLRLWLLKIRWKKGKQIQKLTIWYCYVYTVKFNIA